MQTINVSLTGMLCVTSPLFRPHIPCQVSIVLNPEAVIHVQGRILRSSPAETAIVFESMGEESFNHLKKLVAYNIGNTDRVERELAESGFSMKLPEIR